MTTRPTPEQLRASMMYVVNRVRDTANEMAARYGGCDDPMHPWRSPSEFRDWRDFVDRVARPLLDAEASTDADGGRAQEQEAMRLFRTVSPYYLCTALVMMDNRLKAAP